MCLEHVFNVDNVGTDRMCSGTLFQSTGPATQNARMPSCSLVFGKTKSPRAAERRAESQQPVCLMLSYVKLRHSILSVLIAS